MKHLKLFEQNFEEYYEETDYSLDDIVVEEPYIETIFYWNVNIGNYNLKYKMVRDYEGFNHFYLENEKEISDQDLIEFLYENEDEIQDILMNEI